MKILQVLHFYLPQHAAGTEVYTQRLVRYLAQDHEVELFFTEKVLSRTNYELLERQQDYVKCHVLINNLLYSDFAETFDNQTVEQRFEELLDRIKPDVVHFQHLMLLSLGLVDVAKARGIPVVMTLHDFWLFCPRMGQLLEDGDRLCSGPEADKCASCLSTFKYRQSPLEARVIRAMKGLRARLGVRLDPVVGALRRLRGKGGDPGGESLDAEFVVRRIKRVQEILAKVDRFVSPSLTVLERSVAFGLPEDRALHVRNGSLEPVGTADVAEHYDPRPERLRFAFVGTVAPHKGVQVLVEAFNRASIPGSSLEIYGAAPPAHAEFERELRRRAGPNTRFHGALANPEIASAFAATDVLVVPSTWLENAPVVIEEARWFRRPVIASRLGGMREAVQDEVDGLLFTAGDPDDLARQMRRVADQPDLLTQMHDNAPRPETMEEHGVEIQRIYRELTEASR